MKKKCTFILLILVLFCALSACKKELPKSPYDKNTPGHESALSLSVSWWGDPARSEGMLGAINRYAEERENLTVKTQMLEWGDYWFSMATAAAGHVLPDVMQMDCYYLRQYADKNLLVDLSPYIRSGLISIEGLDQEILKTTEIDGKIYGIYTEETAPVLAYDKTLLDEIGITVADKLTTEEFLKICRIVHEKTGYKTNLAYGIEGFLEYFCRAFGEVAYEEGQMGASEKTLKEYYSLYETGLKEGWLIDPATFADSTIGSVEQDPFIKGKDPEQKSWCVFLYTNKLGAIKKAFSGEHRIGVTTWPSEHPELSEYIRPGQLLCITVDSKQPGTAAELLNALLNDESIRQEEAFVTEVVAPSCTAMDPLPPAEAANAYSLNDTLVEKLWYGEITAREAAEQMLKEGNAILGAAVTQ